MRKLHLMDIGARGGIAWPFTKVKNSDISLVLVEPDPEEATQLEKELASSNIDVKILPMALWSSEDQVKLNLPVLQEHRPYSAPILIFFLSFLIWKGLR